MAGFSQLTIHIGNENARNLPILNVIKEQQLFIKKVDKILNIKRRNPKEDTSLIENEIPALTSSWSNAINCTNIVGNGTDTDFCVDDSSSFTYSDHFNQALNTSNNVTFYKVGATDWTNVKITESQVTDLSPHTNLTFSEISLNIGNFSYENSTIARNGTCAAGTF